MRGLHYQATVRSMRNTLTALERCKIHTSHFSCAALILSLINSSSARLFPTHFDGEQNGAVSLLPHGTRNQSHVSDSPEQVAKEDAFTASPDQICTPTHYRGRKGRGVGGGGLARLMDSKGTSTPGSLICAFHLQLGCGERSSA